MNELAIVGIIFLIVIGLVVFKIVHMAFKAFMSVLDYHHYKFLYKSIRCNHYSYSYFVMSPEFKKMIDKEFNSIPLTKENKLIIKQQFSKNGKYADVWS